MQEDESVKKRRKEDEQDRHVDIFGTTQSLPSKAGGPASPPASGLAPGPEPSGSGSNGVELHADDAEVQDPAYEAFISVEPDDDTDPSFFPPSELEFEKSSLRYLQTRDEELKKNKTDDGREFGDVPDERQRDDLVEMRVEKAVEERFGKRARSESLDAPPHPPVAGHGMVVA